MTPYEPTDRAFEKLTTPNPQEMAFRVALGTDNLRPEDLPALETPYKDLSHLNLDKSHIDALGDYVLTRITDGPPGYWHLYFGKSKTTAEARVPWRKIPGDGRHYTWPKVLLGYAVAEDPNDLVEVTIGLNSTTLQPRQYARLVVRDEQFVCCVTELRYYLSPRPFRTKIYAQPTTDTVTWVLQGSERSLTCLHDDLDLPAPGSRWNLRYSQGLLPGLPNDRRHFPGTFMRDWAPFVISYTHRQTESGVWELVEEWVKPPSSSRISTI